MACAQIGTRIEYAPPRTPQYKASIERWFGTQNRRLLHELPGTTFSNVLDRDEYDPQKHAVISIDACLELVHLWIVDIYHQAVHRGIRDIPHRRWVEKIREWSPNLPPRSADLRVLIGFNADRAISPSGIELFTLRYNSPELAALRLNMKKGEKAPPKYDPQDISVIYVYDRVEDRTIDVPALNQEYTRTSAHRVSLTGGRSPRGILFRVTRARVLWSKSARKVLILRRPEIKLWSNRHRPPRKIQDRDSLPLLIRDIRFLQHNQREPHRSPGFFLSPSP